MRNAVPAAVLLASLFVAEQAHAVFINFESVPGLVGASPSTVGSPVPLASQLSTQLQLTQGVSFSSAPGYVGLAALDIGTTAIGGVSVGGLFDYSAITVIFTVPGQPSSLGITDFASFGFIELGTSSSIMMEAFDVNGVSLGSATTSGTGGTSLSLSIPGTHRLQMSTTGGGPVAFDDLNFNTPTLVPEPTSLALLGVGLTLLASTRRR